MNNESFEERRLRANQALLDAIDMIDPTDPEAGKRYKEIADLYHELNVDIKTQLEHEQKTAERELEREKISTEANTKAEAIKMERERTESEARSEKVKARLDLLGKIMIGVGSLFAGLTQIWCYKRSTEKEVDEALLTQTDQTIVRNGLSGKIWK